MPSSSARYLSILSLILGATVARAEVVRIEQSLHAVPVAISGTLSPQAIAINGKEVPAVKNDLSALLLNGKPVTTESDSTRSFYATTDQDEIMLEGVDEKGVRTEIFKRKLPSIRSIDVEDEKVSFRMEGEIGSFTLDGKEISQKAKTGSGEWPLPADREWINRPHVVELQSPAGDGRLYNLNFSEWRSQLLREQIAAFGFGGIPRGKMGSESGYGFHFWSSWENRLAVGLSAYYGAGTYHNVNSGTYGTVSSDDNSKIWGIGIRGGVYPFLAGQSWFDLRRLIVGLDLDFAHENHLMSGTSSAYGAFNNEDSDSFWNAGVFVREEPMRWRQFGVAFALENIFYRSYPNGGNMRADLEFGYHW